MSYNCTSQALVKRLVRESKEKTDEDFGRKLSAKYVENKKLFWKWVGEIEEVFSFGKYEEGAQ